MHLPSISAQFMPKRSLGRHVALAVALASSVAVAAAALPEVAQAQNRGKAKEPAAPSNSAGFAAAYSPAAALVSGETKNWAGARAQVPAILAAIENEADRNVAGNFLLSIGNQISDDPLRRQGLELMLASGLTAPEQVPLFNYYVGRFAFNAGDYDAARASMRAAIDGGYADGDGDPANDPEYVVLDSYLKQDRNQEAYAYLMPLLEQRVSPGSGANQLYIRRGLQTALNTDDIPRANALSKMLLIDSPTDASWLTAMQVTSALNTLEPQARLDLLRLMRETGTLTQRTEYFRYAEDADPRIMGNEVLALLAEGVAAGHLQSSGDDYYNDLKTSADSRAAGDRRDAAQLYSEGKSGDARDALISGNVLYSLSDFAKAEELYKIALDKGEDSNTALTRIGIAQTKQGKFAEAAATFDRVTGQREIVADMWSLYAQQMRGASTPTAVIADPAPAPMSDAS